MKAVTVFNHKDNVQRANCRRKAAVNRPNAQQNTTTPSQNAVNERKWPNLLVAIFHTSSRGVLRFGGDVDSYWHGFGGRLVTHLRPVVGPSTDRSLNIVSLGSSGARCQKAECQRVLQVDLEAFKR
jgi:hypothetical protein